MKLAQKSSRYKRQNEERIENRARDTHRKGQVSNEREPARRGERMRIHRQTTEDRGAEHCFSSAKWFVLTCDYKLRVASLRLLAKPSALVCSSLFFRQYTTNTYIYLMLLFAILKPLSLQFKFLVHSNNILQYLQYIVIRSHSRVAQLLRHPLLQSFNLI